MVVQIGTCFRYGEQMLSFLTDELDVREVYKLLIGTVIPRPIALISTLNVDGTINLAAFSSYNLVCSNPASINFSITFKPDGSKKDTLINIEREKEFVISSAHPSAAALVVHALVQVGQKHNMGPVAVWHHARTIPSWTALDTNDEEQACLRRFRAFPPHLASSYVTREEAELLHEMGMNMNPNQLVELTGAQLFVYRWLRCSLLYFLPFIVWWLFRNESQFLF